MWTFQEIRYNDGLTCYVIGWLFDDGRFNAVGTSWDRAYAEQWVDNLTKRMVN